MAPEIVVGVPYDTRVDMWSMGVVVYTILGGYQPFNGDDDRELSRKIRKGQYEFEEKYWGWVSPAAKDLIRSMLTVSPRARASAAQLLEDKWMTESGVSLSKRDLGLN